MKSNLYSALVALFGVERIQTRVKVDETGISSSLFPRYFLGSWLNELGVATLILYVVRFLSLPSRSWAQQC